MVEPKINNVKIMLSINIASDNRSQNLIKPLARYKELKNQGRHILSKKEHPVKSEWETICF